MVGITVRCGLLLGLLLCGRVSCTSFIIPWSPTFITNTLSNSLDIYILDKIFFDCSATNTSDVVYVNSMERYDACDASPDVGAVESFPVVSCADRSDTTEIIATHTPLIISNVVPFMFGATVRFIGSNADDCQNGLRFMVHVNSDMNPDPDTGSITITPTVPPATTSANGVSTTTTTHTSDTTVSPTSGAADDGSAQFFKDWSIGAQIGLVAGIFVVVIIVLIVCLVCCVCFCCCLHKKEKKDLIESVHMTSVSPDNDKYNLMPESSITSNEPAPIDDNKNNYKEGTDSSINPTKSINEKKSNNGLASNSISPTRPAPKNSVRPLREPPKPPSVSVQSLPAGGNKYPSRNLSPLASVPTASNAKRRAPPPPNKK